MDRVDLMCLADLLTRGQVLYTTTERMWAQSFLEREQLLLDMEAQKAQEKPDRPAEEGA